MPNNSRLPTGPVTDTLVRLAERADSIQRMVILYEDATGIRWTTAGAITVSQANWIIDTFKRKLLDASIT